jgi:hypothetical protein
VPKPAPAAVEPQRPAVPGQPDVDAKKPAASVQPPARKEAATMAGGFLGLRDEAVFEDEPAPRKKQSWWRKFWPEDE